MTLFRKKPLVIEAVQIKREMENVPAWFFRALQNSDIVQEYGKFHIKTLEGVMTANLGDWIIKGVKDEFYPCKPDIFEATFEAV